MAEFRCEKCDREFGSKDALNMHNQSKHPEAYKEPLLSNKVKKRIRNYGITFFVLLIAAGFFYWRVIPPDNAPIIEIEPSSHNFGTVSQAKGTVSGTMTITNQGNEALVLKNMDSSCGCTSAAVVYKGVEGPRFSMAGHGTNPRDWRQVIPPGESAELKVYYNPNVHRDMRGLVRRSVFIYSNDPRNKVKEVIISANQVD
jgi:hypothetical protein